MGIPSSLLFGRSASHGSVVVAHRSTAVAVVISICESRVVTAGISMRLGAGPVVVAPVVVLAVEHGLVVTSSVRNVVSYLVGEESPEVVPVTRVAAVMIASVAAMMISLVVVVAAS